MVVVTDVFPWQLKGSSQGKWHEAAFCGLWWIVECLILVGSAVQGRRGNVRKKRSVQSEVVSKKFLREVIA